MNKEYFTTFYLDKERDIVVNLYKSGEDELTYVIETPNHGTGNLITSLAKVSGKEISKNQKDLKIITGTIYASINSKNEDVSNSYNIEWISGTLTINPIEIAVEYISGSRTYNGLPYYSYNDSVSKFINNFSYLTNIIRFNFY